jgi:hypothetical protein
VQPAATSKKVTLIAAPRLAALDRMPVPSLADALAVTFIPTWQAA